MEKQVAIEIEQIHNVFVDAETEQYNHTGYDEEYGWEPVPEEWIKAGEISLDEKYEPKEMKHFEDESEVDKSKLAYVETFTLRKDDQYFKIDKNGTWYMPHGPFPTLEAARNEILY